jgi:vacuolar-type H+-ATPase subunit E/Vma4
MPLPELLESLERDAREEAERLDAESRAQAESILARARTRAEELAEEWVREADAEVEADAERTRARARLHRDATLRAAREDAVQEALAEVRSQLEGMRGREDWDRLLRALAEEGRTLLPAAESLVVDPRDAAAAQPLAAEWGVQLETSYSGWGGVVLADGRGRAVRNTLEERFANVTDRARMIVVAGLEREDGG